MSRPYRSVLDTNVAVTANGRQEAASSECAATCARTLQRIMKNGHLFIDDTGHIVREYRNNLSAKGEPGPGDLFLKWVLTHEWSSQRISRVPISDAGAGAVAHSELSNLVAGVDIDRSDQKFIAVALAADERPPIYQALDSKWWGWKDALQKYGIKIVFLCKDEIEVLFDRKSGS